MVLKTIKSIDKALVILEEIKNNKQASLAEISKNLKINKTTAYHILCSLEQAKYIRKNNGTYKYELGIKLMELGFAFSEQLDFTKEAMPYLQYLVDKYSETVHLAVMDEDQVFYVDKIEGTKSINIRSNKGKKLPLHCTGVGKVLLAFQPEATIKRIIDEQNLTRYTDNTIVNPQELNYELSKIRNSGYAIDDEEIETGLLCVAGPIFNYTGQVVSAISISAPKIRINTQTLKVYIHEIRQACDKISAALGYNK